MLKRNKTSFFKINLLEQTKLCNILRQTDDAREIEEKLSLYSDTPLKEKESVIFFDEIQQWLEIITKVKFFVDKGTYRYVLSGSNPGIELKGIKSIPVGYIEQFQMYPMNFMEFSLALGIKTADWDYLNKCFTNGNRVDEVFHEKMLKVFRYYLISGGMPAVVEIFRTKHTLSSTCQEQQNIINQYKADFVKYETEDKKLKIISVYDSIPSQLNKQNLRFNFTYLNKELKFDRYENSFLWLKDASVALPVYIANDPKQPLEISKSTNKFKLFLSDVGLLSSYFPQDCRMDILENNESVDINCGSIYENMVAQEFTSYGLKPYYYKKTDVGEIDFLLEMNNSIVPIEVKSGKDYKKHKSLNTLLSKKEYRFEKAYVLCSGNIESENNITYLPIYMAGLIPSSAKAEDEGYFEPFM